MFESFIEQRENPVKAQAVAQSKYSRPVVPWEGDSLARTLTILPC